MVDEDRQPTARPGPERLDDAHQIVDATQVLDDDTFLAEVVAPHLFDELSVLSAFDVNAAGQRHPGPRAGHLHRTRRGALRRCTPPSPVGSATGHNQDHRAAVHQEPGPEREHPGAPAAVLELNAAVFHPEDRADKSGLRVFDHQSALGAAFHGYRPPGPMRVVGKHIGAISISHPADARERCGRIGATRDGGSWTAFPGAGTDPAR